MSRLRNSGYPTSILVPVCETICRNLKSAKSGKKVNEETRRKIAVLPYVHGITHKLKKIAARNEIQVVCSAPNKAYSMCRRVNNRTGKEKTCDIAHRTQYVPCMTGVVYNIPLSCGKCYIGQTGRCINDRAREHAASLKGTSAGHLAAHCRTCHCSAAFKDITILASNNNTHAREMLEALAIEEQASGCVSTPSITIHKKERQYLRCVTVQKMAV